MIKKLRIHLIDLLRTLLFLFFSRFASKAQERILEAILRVRGYNNFQNFELSGENFFISKILAPLDPKVCIDIGANIGDYSNLLLNRTNAKVFAFEPLPQVYIKLAKRFEDNQDRFLGINMGIGSKVGKDLIHWSPERTGHASYVLEIKKLNYVKNDYEQEVSTTTLDVFVQEWKIERIDLIKIDVEGYEKEVFQGALETIRSCKPKFIQIEMNWHQLIRGTSLLYFADLLPDYKVFQLIKNGWVERNPLEPISNLYLFSNFIFVHKLNK
jgi:FkbM family methyltransferase